MRWIAMSLVCAGCGGVGGAGLDASADVVEDARLDAAVAGDWEGARDTGISGTCPPTLPAEGASCTANGTPDLLCEYDGTYFPECVRRCGSDGKWTHAGYLDGCTASDAGAGDAGCPSSFPAKSFVQCGGAGECDYTAGTCICARSCGGPPDPNPPPSHWICNANPTGCPLPRPRLGDACAQPELMCDYTVCCTGAQMICQNGIWQGNFSQTGCP